MKTKSNYNEDEKQLLLMFLSSTINTRVVVQTGYNRRTLVFKFKGVVHRYDIWCSVPLMDQMMYPGVSPGVSYLFIQRQGDGVDTDTTTFRYQDAEVAEGNFQYWTQPKVKR